MPRRLRVIRGGKPPKLPTIWQQYRSRRWPRFSWRDVRLTLLAGATAGLGIVAVTQGGGAAPLPYPRDTENPAFVRVIDGDTFDYRGMRVRVADIDTPEVDGRCPEEIALASRATRRMRDLIEDGPFSLEPLSGRDEDSYGRKLRIVTRGGRSLGDQLVAEGLARTWSGRREPWC